MSYKLVFSEIAEIEYRQAYDWYDSQVVGLGLDFENEVDESLNRISEMPELYSRTGKKYRKVNVERFPYIIIYSLDKRTESIVIYSIFHTSRRPNKKYRKL